MKNRWITGLIIVLLLLSGLTSCSEKVPQGLSSEVLQNKQMGFSLRYPQDWYHDWVNKNRGLRLSPLEYPDDDPTILALDISMTIFSKDELLSLGQGTGRARL